MQQKKHLSTNLFAYSLIGLDEEGQYTVVSKESIDPSHIFNNMLTRVIIQMLKDQFKDFEDINQVTPVRVKGMQLIE